jgi:integrase
MLGSTQWWSRVLAGAAKEFPGSYARGALRGALIDSRAVQDGPLSTWVFPAETEPEKPLNDAWLRDRVWRPLLEKAKVRHVRIHDARHTYASLMLRRGVPIAYVSRQLGHSSIQETMDLYGHFVPGADRHHVEALAAEIEARRTQQDATPAQHDPATQTAPLT